MAFFVLRYEWVRVYMFKNGIQSYQGTKSNDYKIGPLAKIEIQ